MEADFLVTRKEYIGSQTAAACLWIPKENKIILTALGLLGMLCGALGYVSFGQEEILVRLAWLLMMAVGGYAAAYHALIRPVTVYCKASRTYRRNPKKQEPRSFQLQDDRISFQQGSYRLDIPLSYLYRLVEYKYGMLFFWDMEHCFFIPKRILTEEQTAGLRECVPFSKYIAV